MQRFKIEVVNESGVISVGEAKRRNKKPSPFRGKGKLAIMIIVVAVLIVSIVDFVRQLDNPPLTRIVPARTFGAENAKFKIVEFIDFQCIDCARGSRVLKSYMQKYPKDFQISLKYFPLEERNSMHGAIHAECAAQQDQFWNYYDELISKQNQWRGMNDVSPYLVSLAKNVGIDEEKFKICLDGEEAREMVEHEQRLGEAYFVKSTPTYFINEKMFVGVDEMKKFLDEHYENQRLGLH